ncbi:DUF4260 domain-containing protein [Candidatus Enterococcus mansonii]|uniref:DUF4260 domain-containing protein n=1 Tax=Candidatus Enterococcus mansonii TaxID=1834181 RepID=A0A242CCC5_9ENTE|nr:DUF4260 domain-containing protein [Enterococcus sp. 4G2_DIV0659]OTO07861.1 hypothetical protein A5880_002131 [Enterococcus sp. 4G2_DIV0659]
MTNKTILQIENGSLFLLAFALFIHLNVPVFYFFLWLLLPDITMLGYLGGSSLGANIYNLGHNLVFPVLLTIIYLLTHTTLLLPIAIVWSAHIFMDRTLGYGLKYSDDFKHTHIQSL